MQLRERKLQEGDLSVDWNHETAIQSPRPSGKQGRVILTIALSAVLMIPVEVMAQESPPEDPPTTTTEPTTTTTDESTTTTTVESTTTTTDSPSPSTTAAPTSTTTTTAQKTTTTTTVQTNTTAQDGLETDDFLDDPLEGEEGEDEPQLLPLPSILFPVIGRVAYRDTYDAPRDGGARLHKGTDISAEQGAPVVAVASGVVERMGVADKAGLYVVIRHRNGWRSAYAHLNNDSPGTDNGLTMGFGPGIEVGARVRAGTVVGYVGDSGNSEENSHHLHFELHQPDGYRANPYPALRRARRLSEGSVLPTVDYRQVQAENTAMVAHIDPGTGFNAQIAALDDHVYLGTWGTEDRCPGTGIRVFDVSDPTQPVATGAFADHITFPGTAAASIWVGNVENESFAGRLGVVGLARCSGGPVPEGEDFAGFGIYDLSDPVDPILLSFEHTGAANQGVAGLDVSVSGGQVLLGVVVSNPAVGIVAHGEVFDGAVDGSATGDSLRVFDITDPSGPLALSNWQPPFDPDTSSSGSETTLPGSNRRVTWLDHRTLAAGVESGSTVVLDVTDPENPRESWRAESESEGDLLPGAVIDGDVLMVDERRPVEGEDPAGTHLIVDTSHQPGTKLGAFVPGSVDRDEVSPSGYSLPSGSDYHQAGGSIVAWLSEGLRIIELEEPANPRETAYFIPAPAFDPQRWWTAPDGETRFPMVWDVVSVDGYVYASDHHSGLWVIEITLPSKPLTGSNVAN